eukprot:CAMPEP_0185833644 /NCGR_PEP_ID=MMETSP1353-20130828/3295_1 /TAXON_ID=1077150 /ORGANISM="Erythrolobus australicus, Strain CCMP3124" /LENGTH=143 /DNA_ID=CAMNT_0028531959 /DNA_START=605 /DNA_END=1034 /DNA_ORIENTATION=-
MALIYALNVYCVTVLPRARGWYSSAITLAPARAAPIAAVFTAKLGVSRSSARSRVPAQLFLRFVLSSRYFFHCCAAAPRRLLFLLSASLAPRALFARRPSALAPSLKSVAVVASASDGDSSQNPTTSTASRNALRRAASPITP